MTEFVIGQRWISQSETSLGLGIIVDIKERQLLISFPAVGEERLYATHSAPLTRIEYKPGETIRTQDEQTLQVVGIETQYGRLFYLAKDQHGDEQRIDELDLDSWVELSTPKQRLINGQLDNIRAYQLRCETLMQLQRLQQSAIRGLSGSRISLLPHQIYIAYEVARRYMPRVLLADEVGLGKTIEAGMILHYQLYTGLASRVLIIVPNTLMHQWLVEMLRRFNLRFALFNEERIAGLKEINEGNPFESEQLIICALDTLTADPDLFNAALATEWDMVVVDEAHHLHWDDSDKGHDYRCIESLANKCRGLLLLTATPEQIGASSHFARLRLLDSARFHDLDEFLKEEQDYKPLSDTVKLVLDKTDQPLTGDTLKRLRHYLGDEAPDTSSLNQQERDIIVGKLLDQHGAGRVFLRNTREAIKGFPARKLIPYPLGETEFYSGLQGKQTLFPETEIKGEGWLKQDPRVQWLTDLLNDLKPAKTLVICANAETATTLEKYLQLRVGIRSAAFYEGLSIIERDRAAAYFADHEAGAQVLICSEIGSEGRNFQFAHHLVLFDLPMNPDLLEQRIGRLDRIGQTETINIHIPYIENSAQAVLFNWYNNGLNIFSESCAAAYAIYEKFETQLDEALSKPDIDITLIEKTRRHTEKVKQTMHDGRDRLIELNSCRKDIAEEIINTIKENENPALLMDYMEQMFDVYGVEHEEHSDNTWILHPGDHMRIGYFPGLGDDSVTVTFDREKALSREDFTFASWENPMVSESMDMVLNSEIGNTCITTIEKEGIEAGTILLETFACINAIAPKQLQIERYLPVIPLRTLISKDRKDYSKALPYKKLNELSQKIDRQTAQAIIKQIKGDIETMLDFAMRFTELKLPKIKEKAQQRANDLLNAETERLKQLKKKNATIKKEEIEFLEDQLHACAKIINNAKYKLQAVRLVIVQ